MKKKAAVNAESFHNDIVSTQQLVNKSLKCISRFTRELRPTVLGDVGLLGMKECLGMVGGKFIVVSAPGKGATLRARIPFTKAVPERGNHVKRVR